DFNPRLEPVDEDHAAGWWSDGRQQQGVVAARSNPGDRAGCEAAESVRFEPFGSIVDDHDYAADARRYAPSRVLERKPSEVSFSRTSSDVAGSSAHSRDACCGVRRRPGIPRNSPRIRFSSVALTAPPLLASPSGPRASTSRAHGPSGTERNPS